MKRTDFTIIKRELEALKKEKKSLQYCAFVVIGGLVLVILVSVLHRYLLTMFLLALVLLFQLLYFRKKQKDYQKHLGDVNLRAVVCPKLGADCIDSKGGAGITAETLRQAELMAFHAQGKTVNFFLGIKGSAGGMEVTTADAALTEYYSPGSRRATISCGNWTHIVLPKAQQADLRILDQEVMLPSVRMSFYEGLPKLKLLSEEDYPALGISPDYKESDRELLFYQREGNTAMPPAAFLEKLLDLINYTPGKVAVSLKGNHLDIFIRNRFLGSSFSYHQEPEESLLSRDPFPELDRILELAGLLQD